VRVSGWLCLADNMPSGRATRPGDVLRILGGTTVEVLNTDAEGRLVLADGLVAASRTHPDVIVDVATLTGAISVALGSRHTGVMGSEEAVAEYLDAAESADELAWPLPLPAHMEEELDSPIADLVNAKIGDPTGGSLFAGLFLQRFVGRVSDDADAPRIPWVHLDIAGSGSTKSATGATDKGPPRPPFDRCSHSSKETHDDRTPLRSRRPGRRVGRIRSGDPRGRARSLGRPRREGQARRHVPAPRLHPDQGDPARGGDRRCRPRRGERRRGGDVRGHRRGGVTAFREGIVAKKFKGLTGLIKARGITVVTGEGRLVVDDDGPPSRSARTPIAVPTSFSPPARTRDPPGIEIGGRSSPAKRPSRSQRCPRPSSSSAAASSASSSRARGDRWGGGHDRRGARPPRARGGRRLEQGPERAFRKRGIVARLGSRFASVSQTDAGVTIVLADGSELSARTTSSWPSDAAVDGRDGIR
jgi:hypothetical protein